MRISSRALGASLFSLLAGGLMVAACSDQSGPFLPPPPIQPPTEALAELRCTGSVRLQTVRCERADGSGNQSLLIVGGQHVNVSLYSSNIAVAPVVPDSVDFSFDVVVENLIRQPMGTQDTAAFAPDPGGVRVFFHTGPTATGAGSGDIRVFNPTAVGTFTGSNQPYFEYDQVSRGGVVGPMPLFRNDSTTALNWVLRMPNTVTDFAFTLYVSTHMPYQNGWTDVSPDSALAAWRRFREDTVVVPVGDQVQLQGAVRDRVGRLEATAPTYASSNEAIATVNAAGLVEGVSLGTALISGMASGRPSQRRTRVIVNNPSNLLPDSASALVNVTRSVAAPGVLVNDTDPEDALSVIPGPVTTAEGGTAVLNADGSFTYVSAAGETMARDSFMYHATDGVQEDSAWVVMKLESQGLWYVKADASAGGTGTDQTPFQTIGGAQASAADTDTILVLASAAELDEAATLEPGQTLVGAGIEFDMTYTLADGAVQTVLAAGAAPVLAPQGAGDALTLSTNNTIRGLAITAADGAGISGNGFGTLTTTRLALNPRGPALHLTNGTLAASIDILSSDSSGTEGLFLSSVGGALTAPRGLILDAVGNAVELLSNTATLSLGDSIRSTRGAGGGIVVSMNSGAITFSAAEKTLNTGASSGVGIVGNSGSILFSGGGLAITTTSGTGFGGALSGGTLEVTGSGNTVSSGTGVAVALNTLNLGAAGITFVSVSANGGTNGILLQSVTGGGLQVTGDGTTDGSGGTIQNTTGSGVSLTSVIETELSFLDVTQSSAFPAIAGSTFGTLTVDNVAVTATGGPALSLATGTLNGDFGSLVSTNSATSGVILNAVAGSFTSGGSITGAAGTALDVVGGTVTMGYTGDITQGNNAALLSVSGSHATGTLTFSTGTLSATGGTGLSFNSAAGSYVFSGTTTLNGGDAGVDITNGSTGTFTFGTGTSITSPTGSAFTAYGSSANVTYSGNITKGNAGLMVEIGEQPGGTITFQTGTLSATLGTGISLSNADGTVNFNGTTTLGGGDAGVDVVAGSAGTFGFGSTTTITNPTGHGLHILDSAPTALNYAGTITTGPASLRPVLVDGPAGACGIINVSGDVASTGLGVMVQDCTSGTVTFSGDKTLATTVNQAVTLANNTGAAIAFTSGNLVLTTTTASGFRASGGGTIEVAGAGNTINSGTGTALDLNGVILGAGGMTFGNVTATGATNGVNLTNVTGPGTITASGGTITGGAGGAAFLVSGGTISVSWLGGITQALNNALLSVSGGHTGSLTFQSGTLSATNGTGLQFNNADGTYAFAGTTNLSNAVAGGDAGIDVTNGSAGTFTFPTSTSITSPSTGNLITILNSAPTFTYSGSLTKANNNVTGILAQSNTGGTITFNGDATTLDADAADVAKTISSGTAAAVNLSSNTGVTFVFSGGGLAITSTSGAGFSATGGGTVTVTGAGNTIASGAGTALNVQNTTIGASGLTFLSIAHSGGANGIFLSGTGTTNGLQVTGSGTAGSGGTIVNTTGGDGATSGNGIYLNGTRNVSLSWMALSGHANNGFFGTGVRGLTMNKMRFTGNNGTSNSGTFDESPLHLVDLGGAVKVTNSRLDGGAYNAVLVENIIGTAPVLDSLVFENDTIESMQGSTADVRGTALLVHLQDGSADTRIRNNRVTVWWGNAIHVVVQGTASGTTRITGNFADNTNGALAGAGGIGVAGGTHQYNISGNTVRHTDGAAISADRVNFGTTMQGTIDGNFIGVSGDNGSGSRNGAGIFASHHGPGTTTHRISNNTIRQVQAYSGIGAIWVLTGDALGFGGSGTLNATVVGNNIQENATLIAPINAHSGILATIGTQSGPPTDTDQVCLDIGGGTAALHNTIANFNMGFAPGGNNRIRVNQRFGTTTRFPGYTGAQSGVASQTQLGTYLLGRNTASNSTNANTSTGGFLNTVPAGSACPQPSL